MNKEYCFYGWQNATMNRNNPDFPGITTPQQLYDILSTIWCRRTCKIYGLSLNNLHI